jgi:hypothetical protein
MTIAMSVCLYALNSRTAEKVFMKSDTGDFVDAFKCWLKSDKKTYTLHENLHVSGSDWVGNPHVGIPRLPWLP